MNALQGIIRKLVGYSEQELRDYFDQHITPYAIKGFEAGLSNTEVGELFEQAVKQSKARLPDGQVFGKLVEQRIKEQGAFS